MPGERRRRGRRGARSPLLGGRADELAERPLAASPHMVDDPVTGLGAEVHYLQSYQVHKAYRCPGCNQEIRAGTGHVVVVPIEAADLRRHWHRPCWDARDRRRPGRRRRPDRT